MFSKLAEIEAKYDQLMAELSSPAVQGDNTTFRNHSKALAEIQPLVEHFRDYKEVVAQISTPPRRCSRIRTCGSSRRKSSRR